ncbi:hypothetical protein CFP56_011222 [Quercus suber]|uniref:Uncharacterized protein n=1 Tax=Quercus suber TaxID=58331 RepID=A0AAW0MC04_QUESU
MVFLMEIKDDDFQDIAQAIAFLRPLHRVQQCESSQSFFIKDMKCGQMVDAKWGYSFVNAFKYVGMLGDLISFLPFAIHS